MIQHAFLEPQKLPSPQWPANIKPDLVKTKIADWNHLLDDFKALMIGKLRPEKFVSTHATSDFSWEDPMERFDGKIYTVLREGFR